MTVHILNNIFKIPLIKYVGTYIEQIVLTTRPVLNFYPGYAC